MKLAKSVFIAFCFILLFFFAQSKIRGILENQKSSPQVLETRYEENQKTPVHIKIPSISVDAFVEQVGVLPTGVMETPSNTLNVGWFNLGPRPGEAGSSVIAGHLDGEDGKPGVFINLNKLKIGDEIIVEKQDGTTATFKVTGSKIYNPGYAEEVFSSSEGSLLNLITCDGVWDGSKKSFNKRLVVFAKIVQ